MENCDCVLLVDKKNAVLSFSFSVDLKEGVEDSQANNVYLNYENTLVGHFGFQHNLKLQCGKTPAEGLISFLEVDLDSKVQSDTLIKDMKFLGEMDSDSNYKIFDQQNLKKVMYVDNRLRVMEE